MLIYFLSILLLLIGIYGITTKRNIIKTIIGLTLMEYAIFTIFIVKGYKKDAFPPITGAEIADYVYVDPLAQAMIITAIVIGFATTLLLLSFTVKIYQKFKSLDINDLKDLKG
ncbi:MAG: Na(+)/H(+) antiporter subunit C1 [candidate division WS2 bacterium]|nr:Na(+)/H(+) antiporter subunit C1 [Candidatus Lithacetigena glycinireducens]